MNIKDLEINRLGLAYVENLKKKKGRRMLYSEV